MESLSEFLAQTSPITCGGVAHGAESRPTAETVPDLSLGLDLGLINWDLGTDFGSTAVSSSGGINHLENQTANLLEQSANQYINDDRRAVNDDDAHRCFEGLDLLDFELNEEVLMTLTDFENLHHVNSNSAEAGSPLQAPNMDTTYFSQINSPSAEQTYLNLESISTTMNTTVVGSPAESSTLLNGEDSVMNYYYSSSAEDSPAPSVSSSSTTSKIRRTRARTIDKKESNKAAAIKYRSKKMKERESLFAECEEYAKRNAELKKKIDDTQSEISFIKSLLVEALIAKSVPK